METDCPSSIYTFNKWYTLSDEIKKTNSILQLLHGNVVAMTDQNKEVVATYEYDSWGNVLKSDAKGIATDNPFGYAGYMYDKEIGMYYLIARYYNPEHGVFLSVDPNPGDEDDPVTQNGYTYGDNNPVMMVDPDGHWVWFAVNAGFAAYDGYKAYKSGKGWKGVAKAAAISAIGGGKLKLTKQLQNRFILQSY